MTALRVLIVDDEPPARRKLRALLEREPDVEIVGECANGEEAIASVQRTRPDLLLLDVQMPGLDGFDVIEALGPARAPAVIFITAHDVHAVRAFEVHAVDYLLKPFDRERLRLAVARAREAAGRGAETGGQTEGKLRAILAELNRPVRLVVRSHGRVLLLRAEEVDWAEAADNYVILHVGAESHMLRETMNGLESRLDPSRFARIHRSRIVNLDRIRELLPAFHGEYVVVLENGTKLPLSRSYRDRLASLLGDHL
jgi:two-component system LytT family response regulator